MTKDRLANLREAQTEKDEFDSPHDTVPLEDYQYMNDFFSEVEDIRTNLQEIQSKVDDVKLCHSNIISSPDQDERYKIQLEEYTSQIKLLGNKVRSQLKSMERSVLEKTVNENSADFRIIKTQQSTLSRKFVDVMTDYNNCQIAFRDRCKVQILRQFQIADRSVTNEELDDMLLSDNPKIFTKEIVMDTQQAKQSMEDIEARHADIVKLEKSIKELHDMFMDMAMLVESQGEMVDRIEYNVNKTVDYVDDAKKETTQAVLYQKSARKKKLIIIGICVLIAIILAVIIGLSIYLSS